MDITVSKIDISFSVHATENIDKNYELLSKIVVGMKEEQVKVMREDLEGGYGNPITFIHVSFTKNPNIEKVLKLLKERLLESDKELLLSEFPQRFDSKKSSFYIRLDKENLIQDIFKVTNSANVIKITLKLRAFTKQAEFKEFLISKGILS